MNDIRHAMGYEAIKEQINLVKDDLREQYFKGEIFNVGDIVESDDELYEIVKRGSNHLLLKEQSGNLISKWIQDVAMTENKKGLLEDIGLGYAPSEISFKGYTTKNLHHSADAARAFQDTIKRYGAYEPAAILSALKATDTFMKLNDMHLEQGKAPDDAELNVWRNAHTSAKDSLQKIGEFQHHMDYWRNHGDEIMRMEGDYNPSTAGADMNEELTDKTIKPNDKLKVARIIAAFLGVESPESLSNPEQIVNMGLRKAHTKSLHKDSVDMLRKMMGLADEVGIKYDTKLLPKTIKESIGSTVTVDTNSNYNMAKGILRYSDFKKLMKMNKGVVEVKKPVMQQDDDDMDPTDYDDKVAGVPDDKDPDTGIPPTATEIADKNLENQGPRNSEVGHAYGHGNNSQLRRRMAKYATESVEIEEDVASADYKVNPETGRKSRARVVTFANSKMGGKPDDTPNDNEDENEYKRTNKKMAEAAEVKLGKKIRIKADQLPSGGNKAYDAFFQEEQDDEMDEKDLDQLANSINTVDDVLDAYDDHELAIIDDESGEEIESDLKEEALDEVLSRDERIKAKVRFARSSSKRKLKTRIALKKRSDSATINARARKLAIKLIKTRLTKKDPSKLSIGEKERVERFISARKTIVNRLAMKLVSRVRKIENDRLSHHKYTKK
jgi:hypothetical protein